LHLLDLSLTPLLSPTQVFWSDWAMARDPAVWGPDAAQFKPERWLDSEGSLKRESQYKFHAFNGGYRVCVFLFISVTAGACRGEAVSAC